MLCLPTCRGSVLGSERIDAPCSENKRRFFGCVICMQNMNMNLSMFVLAKGPWLSTRSSSLIAGLAVRQILYKTTDLSMVQVYSRSSCRPISHLIFSFES